MRTYAFEKMPYYIKSVEDDARKVQEKIHALAISLLSHWANTPADGAKVAEYMTMLQNSSPYHAKAFADWVALKTGMSWAEETAVWYVQKNQKIRKDTLDAARDEPFWKVSKPQKPKPLTDEGVLKLLQGILDNQKKHEKKPVEGDAFSIAGNEHIRAAIKAISAASAAAATTEVAA